MNWTEKYRPDCLKKIIGNRRAKDLLKKWAEKWENGSPIKKAVILYGKPGVGKTTSAIALANDFNWQTIELNASDERNKDIIKKIAFSGAVNETLSFDGKFVAGKKKLIILDEADNLYEKEGDYGGKKAIIDTINATKQPIVLIVNDYYQLIKGDGQPLKNLCMLIEFKPVNAREIVSLLKRICIAEKIKADEMVLYEIAKRSNGDVRSAINDLQSMAYENKIDREKIKYLGYRDKQEKIFTALHEILKAKKIKDAARIAYRIDESPENLILWMDENIPNEYSHSDDLQAAYKILSRADIFLERAWRRRYYGLWSYATELMAGGVAVAKKHEYTSFNKYSFPTWLRGMAAGKQARWMKERIAKKIGVAMHCSKKKAMDMIPFVKKLLEREDEMASYFEFDKDELYFLVAKEIYNKRHKNRKQATLF